MRIAGFGNMFVRHLNKKRQPSRTKNSQKREEVEEEVDCQLSNWLDYAIVQQQKHFFRAIVRVY